MLVTCLHLFLHRWPAALADATELAAPGLQVLSNEQFNRCSPCTALSCCCSIDDDRVRFRQPWCCRCRSAPRRGVSTAQRRLVLVVSCSAPRSVWPASSPPAGRPTRWTAYTRLTRRHHLPGAATTCGIMGLHHRRLGTILGGVNMISKKKKQHVRCMRARDDDVPDAYLHLEHPGYRRSWC